MRSLPDLRRESGGSGSGVIGSIESLSGSVCSGVGKVSISGVTTSSNASGIGV